ncbi:MAG: CYTH domain-containing protein [Gammaproteobacteria bacterium]|nr:CYTH domain-containing protein [Gammaproteobacteria bacterium]
MSIEIERKFLLKNDDWKHEKKTQRFYQQAYFCNTLKVSVRVRISDDEAWVSFKSSTKNISRYEFEYNVPLADAQHMIEEFAQGSVISKIRYFVPIGQHIYEIDVFEGDNAGLVVAEVELSDEQEEFIKPNWLGKEVSDDVRYFNNNLVGHPYKEW